jgi:hypothetical protein
MQLQKISNIQPASFVPNNREDSLQIKLIVGLLKSSIEEGKSITLDDIRYAHAEYAMTSRRNGSGYNWFIDDDGEKRWRRAKSKEEWFSSHCYPSLSVTWFKNNLGAAILKGRILAIPVIELDEIVVQ